MSITNYPFGVSSYGVPLLGPVGLFPFGKVFFVKSSTGQDAAGKGLDPSAPFATLDYAITKCTSGNGDIILILPGHSENVDAAGDITIDKSDVTILGCGNGSSRPTFTWTTANTATIVVSGNNVTIANCIFQGTGFAAVATMFSVSGTNCRIQDNYFLQTNATNQAVLGITITAAATGFKLLRNQVVALTAGATAFLSGAAATDDVEVAENLFIGDFATAAINNITAAWTNVNIHHNRMRGTNASEPMVELHASATGIINDNYLGAATFAASGSVVADGAYKFQNYVTDTLAAAASSGILDPVGVTL